MSRMEELDDGLSQVAWIKHQLIWGQRNNIISLCVETSFEDDKEKPQSSVRY